MNRFLGVIFLLFIWSNLVYSQNCTDGTASYATGGSSVYKDQILWLTWGGTTGGSSGTHGQSLLNGTKTRAIFNMANKQMCFECEVVTTALNLISYKPGSWSGDALDDLYNINGVNGNNKLINGISVTGATSDFVVKCIAKLDGVPYKIKGLVMADAESLNANSEFLKAAGNGSWNVVEMNKTIPTNTGAYEVAKYLNIQNKNEIAITKGNDAGAAAVSFLSFNNTAYLDANFSVAIDFSIKGGGTTGIAIGLLVPNADGGDAPHSYGEVYHLIKNINITSDGISENNVKHNLNRADFQTGKIIPPTDLFLGTKGPDAERAMLFSANATGDQITGDNPNEEDAWPLNKKIIYNILPGRVIDIDVPYVSYDVATIAGWIDFNHNGVFDANERAQVTTTNTGAGTSRLSWTVPAGFIKGKTFVRLRMSTLASDVASPIGIAVDGEVEDHEIYIDDPKFTISKSSNATNNIWNNSTLDKKYFLAVTNIATVSSYGTIKVLDLLPEGITPNWTGVLNTNGWSLTYSGQLITATTTQNIASNAISVIEVPVNVNTNLASATYINKASVGGGGDNDYPSPIDPSTCTDTSGNSHCITYELQVIKPIDAQDDTYSSISSNTTTSIGNILTNDTLDGTVTSSSLVTITQTGNNSPIQIDNNGNVFITPGTPSGTYTTTYQICETGATPANCDTATITVVVNNPLVGGNDPETPYNENQNPGPSVIGNDTLNGTPVTPVTPENPNGNVTITNIPVTGSPVTVNPNGTITATPGTPIGEYPFSYEICEAGANPDNCQVVTGSIVISNPTANNDSYQVSLNNIPSAPVGNVLGNDFIDGTAATTSNVTVSQTGNNTHITIDANGNVIVTPGTPAGTYTTEYQICKINGTSLDCDTAVVTVVVTTPIDANDDTVTFIPGQPSTPSVLDNDTFNGQPINPTDVVITNIPVIGSPVTVNPDGTVSVTPGTTSGTYTAEYQLCENRTDITNCDTAIVTVVVSNPIVGEDDLNIPYIPGQTLPNVTNNDTFNGQPFTPGQTVEVTNVPVAGSSVTVNPDGTLSVPATTPGGTYNFSYTICEIGVVPQNCDTVVGSVVVSNPDANDDFYVNVPANNSTVGNVLENDTVEGNIATPSTVNVTQTGSNANISIDPNGNVAIAPGTPSGTYTTEYQICKVGTIDVNSANCDTATVTVVVVNELIGEDDPNVPYVPGQPVNPNVTENDTLNGTPVVPITPENPNGNVTIVQVPPTNGTTPITINPDGTIEVTLGTPSGDYPFEYIICEVGANPSNCENVVGNVVVTNPIVATNDSYGPVANTTTTLGNILGNDTLSGTSVTVNNVSISQTGSVANILIDENGNVTIVAGTPSGTYTTKYQICETGANPANCATATVTVVVVNELVGEDDPNVPYIPGQPVNPNVTENDTLNGTPVVPVTPENPNGNVTIVQVPPTNGTTPITINPDGIIEVTPGTPSGDYPFEYTICEVGSNPSNCENVVGNVVVNNPIVATDDHYGFVNSGSVLGNIYINDSFNGNVINPTTITTTVSGSGADHVTLNPDGSLTLNPNTPAGNYSFTYTICENNVNPANCDTATVTYSVNAGPETAGTTVSTLPETAVSGNITITPGNGTVTNVTTPNLPNDVTVVINNDGSFTVTPGGTYEGGSVIEIPYVVTDSNGLTAESVITVEITEVAQMALVKSSEVIGNQIVYTFTVTNTGNVTLNNVEIQDAMLSTNPIAVMPATLAPGQSATVVVNYNITLANLDAGSVTNTASTSGISTVGTSVNDTSGSTLTGNDPTVTPLVQNPSISLVKTSSFTDENQNGFAEVGETITYTFVATNTGDVTLQNVVLSDQMLNVSNTTFTPSVLLPGETTTMQLTYTLTQNDVDLGLVINSAEAESGTLNGELVFDISGTEQNNDEPTQTSFEQNEAIAIIKTAIFNDENADGVAQVGETISYSFDVKNTGEVTLYNVTVQDNLTGIVLNGNPIASLAPGEVNQTAYNANYAITLQDIINGSVTNQATVTATTINDGVITDQSDNTNYNGNTPTVVEIEGCKINIFNAVSPDNDGMNDFFYIQGVECYTDNHLEIYNRWGVLVYETKGYNNADKSFKGYSEGRVTVSKNEELPVGTYFYIFKYVDLSGETHKIQSYLYLNR